jgi:hypothetical protein
VPYNYSLKPAGDGWNQGEVWLAFENKTNDIILPTIQLNLPKGVVVETVEGPKYPATIVYKGNTGLPVNPMQLYLLGPMPPGFRASGFTYGGSLLWYAITWKSATAATPKRIIFSDYPELSFGLPELGSKIKFPFDNPPRNVKSFADLKGVVWSRNEKGVEVIFTGRCGNLKFLDPSQSPNWPNELYIEVQVQNHDAFNQQELAFNFPVSSFYYDSSIGSANGLVVMDPRPFVFGESDSGGITPPYSLDQKVKISIGPGQSRRGLIRLYFFGYWAPLAPPIVVLWRLTINTEVNDYQIYDAKGCTIRK